MKKSCSYLLIFLSTIFLISCGGDNDDERMSVFDALQENPDYSTLVSVLESTGLDETLDNLDMTFTVFAPNNAAFDNVDADALAALLADTDALSNVLLYHVVSGTEINSAGALDAVGTMVTMANQLPTTISMSGDNLFINLSTIIATDQMTDNGIIHGIDQVLIPAAEPAEPSLNIVETAMADGRFTTLVAAVAAADLVGALSDPNASLTVFAPTDDAFAALGQGTINALLNNIPELTDILEQHVIGAEVSFLTALTLNGGTAGTLGGETVAIEIMNGQLTVGGANVIIADLPTTNGVIHVIDAVIADASDLPPLSLVDVANNAGNFTTLLAALDEAELTSVLADTTTDFTVFAPTDEAFMALLTAMEITAADLLANPDLSNILLYHVLPGVVDSAAAISSAGMLVETASMESLALSLNGNVLNINTAQVTTPDVAAANGLIHIIDQVLLPPAEVPAMLDSNIVETAVADGRFTTLVTALQAAGLDTLLSNEAEEFTVFAPTDDAFALLGDATIMALLDDIPTLTDILELHVVQDITVDSLTAFTLSGTDVMTAGGESIPLLIQDGMLTVGGSNVIITDIYTNNGVIHVIDAVITM